MHILKQSNDFLQTQILPCIPKQHQKLFVFGFQALTLQSFVSLNGNARMTLENRKTAETKIYRLVSKEAFPHHFSLLVSHLKLCNPTDTVNVDFSSFGGFEILTFAKQTYLGRAMPLHFGAIQYPLISPGSQTKFIIEEIKTFKKLLGFCPKLVFDRGFELPYLISFLLTEQIVFTIRLRKDKHVLFEGKELPLRNLPWFLKDSTIGIYGKRLRIVVSEKKQDMDEPWYILTNDFNSSSPNIIASYYFRFEIEETFKDLKHVNKLKRFFPIQKPLTLIILLWFCTLTIWFSFLLTHMQDFIKRRILQRKRKRLSVTRYFFEQIQQAKLSLILQAFPP